MSEGRSIDSHSPVGKLVWCALITMVFVLIGILLMRAGFSEMRTARASAGWPQTPGKVFKSSIDWSSDSDSSTGWRAQVAYTYSVGGTEMKGNRVSLGDYGSSNSSHAQGIVNRYPVGRDITVYYDPRNPATCLLEPGVQAVTYILPLLGLAFFAMGSLCFGLIIRSVVVGSAPG